MMYALIYFAIGLVIANILLYVKVIPDRGGWMFFVFAWPLGLFILFLSILADWIEPTIRKGIDL